MAGTRGLVHSQGPCKVSKDPKRGVSGRRRKRGMRMGVGEEMDAPNREPTPLWSLASPPSARALPGPAAICERDRSSFQKLFLLWDLGLGGDQTQTSREQEEQRPAAWRSVFSLCCRTSHTLTLTLTPPPFSQLSVCFPLDPLLLFPLPLLRGREREILDSQVHTTRLSVPLELVLSSLPSHHRLCLVDSLIADVDGASPNDDAERTRPTPARTRRASLHPIHHPDISNVFLRLHRRLLAGLGDYDGREPCHERWSLLT